MSTGRKAQERRYRAADAGCPEHVEDVRRQLGEMESEFVRAEKAGERPVMRFRLLEAICEHMQVGGVWSFDRELFGPETMGPFKGDK